MTGLPRTSRLRAEDTHRLIPSRFLPEQDSVLTRIADDDTHLADIFDLDNATNDRLLGEGDLLPGIGRDELVAAVPGHTIVNGCFCHAHPEGARFNGPDRGAWYAGLELDTAMAEVVFHKSVELHEIHWPEPEDIEYEDVLADFNALFHDLRDDAAFAPCLDPDSYVASQALARRLLESRAAGVVYPSVRRPRGTCLACFRPALVGNVHRAGRYVFCWRGPDLSASMQRAGDL